jgi:hypothetical protein
MLLRSNIQVGATVSGHDAVVYEQLTHRQVNSPPSERALFSPFTLKACEFTGEARLVLKGAK